MYLTMHVGNPFFFFFIGVAGRHSSIVDLASIQLLFCLINVYKLECGTLSYDN